MIGIACRDVSLMPGPEENGKQSGGAGKMDGFIKLFSTSCRSKIFPNVVTLSQDLDEVKDEE